MMSLWNTTGWMDCCEKDLCNNQSSNNTSHQTSITNKQTIPSGRNCTKNLLVTGHAKLVPEHLIAMNEDHTCLKRNSTEVASKSCTDGLCKTDSRSKRSLSNVIGQMDKKNLPISDPSKQEHNNVTSQSGVNLKCSIIKTHTWPI